MLFSHMVKNKCQVELLFPLNMTATCLAPGKSIQGATDKLLPWHPALQSSAYMDWSSPMGTDHVVFPVAYIAEGPWLVLPAVLCEWL